MRQFLLIFIACCVGCVTAESAGAEQAPYTREQRFRTAVIRTVETHPGPLPDEDSLSTNYEARHATQHGKLQQNSAPGADSLSTNYEAEHEKDNHHVVARCVDRKRRQTSPTCDSSAQFRSADGTCNNLDHPTWGSANQPFLRLKTPVYNDGVRQQMNELSAYLDGSNVYGRNESEMTRLRSSSGDGKLRMGEKNNLPQSSANFCILDQSDDYCLDAGAMHTIFARYHNHITEGLKSHHPSWDDDLLFNTARKIVIAVLQQITYNEYLPTLLVNSAMTKYGLTAAYEYDSSCDASLYNVFSTAAFRFGHSMVTDSLEIGGGHVSTQDLFSRPHHVTNNLDSLLSGMARNPSERADRWYSLTMTDHLFGDLDIAALNIQRGRDHGLPPYNTWRELCGESVITDFDQLPRHAANRFRRVYGDPADIDLYSGALTETREGVVGPTYACLLGQQFARLRNCDRFWWETSDPNIGFTTNQARQIQRTKLSHVICQTTNVSSIQERVFRVPDDRRNAEASCSSILANAMDVSFF